MWRSACLMAALFWQSSDSCVSNTQLCLSAAAAVALSGKAVVIVDTTGGFSAIRLTQLLGQLTSGRDVSQEVQRRTIESVRCCRVFDVHAALQMLEQLRSDGQASEEGAPSPSLLIVDSVSALLSPLLTTKHPQGDLMHEHPCIKHRQHRMTCEW